MKKLISLTLLTASFSLPVLAVDLSAKISSNYSKIKVKSPITYTGSVLNNSTNLASNVRLEFYLPPKNVVVNHLPSDCFADSMNTITCALGNLTANSSAARSVEISYSKTLSGFISVNAISDSPETNRADNSTRLLVNAITGNSVANAPNVTSINANPTSIIQGNALTFTANLDADLPSGYSVKVDYGSGLTSMNGSGTSFSLNVTPSTLGSKIFTVGIYDNTNTLKSNSLMTGNFSVTAPISEPIKPEPNLEPHAFNYTKISADGEELADNAQTWACVRDNATGLIWEAKTDDGGLHDKDSKYSWYNPNIESKGTFRSYEYSKWCKGSNCDTYGFVTAVNNERLCGLNNWRMPEKEELMTLVYCSDGKYDDDDGECSSYQKVQRPTITSKYFVFTRDSSYWTASQNLYGQAVYIGFDDGISYSGSKSSGSHVRLVHDGE